MSNDNDLQDPWVESLSVTPEPSQPLSPNSLSKKRKRQPDEEKPARKAPKNSKRKRKRHTDDDNYDIEAGINKAFGRMDSQLLADYLTQRTTKHEPDISSVELEDRILHASAIQDTTSWEKPRTINNLPGFLEKYSRNATKLWSASKKNGTPHTIIVTAAGLRAAELARVVRNFQTKDATVAKLFAKHIKLKDSVNFLKSTRTGIAVGTPTRLRDLMDDGALAIDRLERIVVDVSHIDQKKRGILDMKETQIPLTNWLGQPEFRRRYSKDDLQLLFY